jgi:hypothetical protein
MRIISLKFHILNFHTDWFFVTYLFYFAWEKSNTEFTSALESQGIDVFVNLLVNDPNTAYSIFIAQ